MHAGRWKYITQFSRDLFEPSDICSHDNRALNSINWDFLKKLQTLYFNVETSTNLCHITQLIEFSSIDWVLLNNTVKKSMEGEKSCVPLNNSWTTIRYFNNIVNTTWEQHVDDNCHQQLIEPLWFLHSLLNCVTLLSFTGELSFTWSIEFYLNTKVKKSTEGRKSCFIEQFSIRKQHQWCDTIESEEEADTWTITKLYSHLMEPMCYLKYSTKVVFF